MSGIFSTSYAIHHLPDNKRASVFLVSHEAHGATGVPEIGLMSLASSVATQFGRLCY